MKVLIAILCVCVGVFAQDSAKEDSARQNRAQKHILTTKKPAESNKKVDSAKADSAKINRQNRTKTLTTPKSAESNNFAESTHIAPPQLKQKKLGYRNVKITSISKQRSGKIDFFVGAQFGINIVSMQEIIEQDRIERKRSWKSGGVSLGAKGGIVSEEERLGGRFYAEFSYARFPKFNVLNVGVDLDLLIKYFEAQKFKIGGFLGLGGGMDMAFVADSALKKEGEKSLIAVGWVNVGLARLVYYHRTGVHSVELNAKIAFVTPTIYSLKDVKSGITTSYKGSASGITASYIYQF